ncbi:glycosyltransferase [Bacillus infantis]|uniref:CgeB family protein n=1 Tax=Bacillus infantis TaxID=324767 RepID=UPI001CD6D430|nr:glycosyltransferase [Bacillus infantis]MCA1033589.1 glycosyltransferase [Bacillus infantis]
MDLQVIEKKLAKITERKKKISFELGSLEAPRLTVQEQTEPISDWWFRAQPPAKTELFPGGLHAEIPPSQHLYLSYREANVVFSKPPELGAGKAGEKQLFRFSGKASGTLTADLYIIGYLSGKKVWMKKIPLGNEKEISLENGENIRIALKLKGSGSLDIKELSWNDEELPIAAGGGKEPASDQFISFPASSLSDRITYSGKEMFAAALDQKYMKRLDEELALQLPNGRYATLSLGSDALPAEMADGGRGSLTVNADSFYEVYFQAKSSGRLEKELLIIGYNDGRSVDVKCIGENKLEKIQLAASVKEVRFFLRLKGTGILSSASIHFEEKPKIPLAVTDAELQADNWFAPPPSQSEFIMKEGKLALLSDLDSSQTKYVSYNIKNISFKVVPKESAFAIEKGSYYEIDIAAEKYGSGLAVPILVTYTEEEKKDIIPLVLNERNIVRFKKGITKCRIAFKLSGPNEIVFERFAIRQFREEQTGGGMVWTSPKEVERLGLVPKRDLKQVKLAVIFDEFTTECFAHECELISFTPDNWKQVLTANMPDLLMVESAWRGNAGAWTKKVQYTGEEAVEDLKELLDWCSEQHIPTVFWNKEDPVHFNHFVQTAELFDYIFTTDANSVQSYKDACGHDRVGCLPFAAQPKIHNPLTIGPREKAASFAGSYYAKHVERSESMLRIFNQAIPFGLAIYDRNYEKVQQGLLKNNRFPDHLQPYVKGSLKYYEIDKSYKGYRVMINVNTVQHSPTMFARRVYEGLASGTPIVSNHSDGVKRLFGDLICVSEDEEEIAEAFRVLFEDEAEYRRIAKAGITRVLSEHTYLDRLERICGTLNLPFARKELGILVFAKAKDDYEAALAVENFQRQKWENKRLCLLMANGIPASLIEDSSISVWNEDEYFSCCQNLLMEQDYDYAALFKPGESYSEDFLLNLALTSRYAPWEVIGEHGQDGLYYGQVPSIQAARGIFRKELFSALSSNEALECIEQNKTELFSARGARLMGVPHT